MSRVPLRGSHLLRQSLYSFSQHVALGWSPSRGDTLQPHRLRDITLLTIQHADPAHEMALTEHL